MELLHDPNDNNKTKDRKHVRQKKHLLKGSSICSVDPFVDNEGIIRFGCRLRRSNMNYPEKHPILLPKGHCLSQLVVQHQHEKIHYQGRQITHGAVLAAGNYWILGGHNMELYRK